MGTVCQGKRNSEKEKDQIGLGWCGQRMGSTIWLQKGQGWDGEKLVNGIQSKFLFFWLQCKYL